MDLGERCLSCFGGHARRQMIGRMFNWLKNGKAPEPRKGMPSPRLDESAFKQRFRSQFKDPAFAELATELDKITHAAWEAYKHSRKAPHTRKAARNSPIPTMSFRSIGSRRAKRCRRRSGSTMTPLVRLASC